MAARFLPDASATFSHLLRRRLAQTLGTGALLAGLALTSGCERNDVSCFDLGPDEECSSDHPMAMQLGDTLCMDNAEWEVVDQVTPGPLGEGDCCSQAVMIAGRSGCTSPPPTPVQPGVVEGRPLVLDGAVRTAPLRGARRGDGWVVATDADVSDLSPDARAWLAARWLRAARMEHASIASFAKFALDLTAHGAPADLLIAAHAAAADEVRHARRCFSLAATHGGEAVAPGPIEFPGGRVEIAADLASLVTDVVREGCIGETLAAVQAAEQLATTRDRATAQVLAGIVEDETRHAELAWRTVRWAVALGGEPVARAAAEVFATADALAVVTTGDHDDDLSAWGFPPSARVEAALERAVSDVIRPAAAALLG